MTDDAEADMREQLRDAFAGADYPLENQMDLVPALPNGPTTRFETGETAITAMELGTKLSAYQEFPYDDVDTLVDDIIAGMRKEEML